LGPLFYYELVRLARKGRGIVLRCAYALAVFAAMYFTYKSHFPGYDFLAGPFSPAAALSPGDAARLTEAFAATIFAIQTAAILVLTPAYLAGALAEEKERGTLELLLTTRLRDREIVLGKLAARATHLAGVLLAGLPLLAITQLWGGVDIFLLAAAFLGGVLNLFAVGSVSICCSARSSTVIVALGASYLTVAVLTLVGIAAFGPALTSYGLFDALRSATWTFYTPMTVSGGGGYFGPLFSCIFGNGLVSLVAVALAAFDLRPYALAQTAADAPVRRARASAAPGNAPRPKAPLPADAKQIRPLPPVGRWPLVWKETNRGKQHFPPRVEWFLERYWAVLLIPAGYVGWLLRSGDLPSYVDRPRLIIAACSIVLLVVFGLGWCCDLAFRSAISVCRERERRTLDVLLTIPASRAAVLGAKWLGAILSSRIGYVLIFVTAVNVGSGMLPPDRALLGTLLLGTQVAFLASLGICVSVRSRTTLRAQVTMAVLLLVFFGGAWIALAFDAPARIAMASVEATASTPGGVPMTARMTRALLYDVGINPVRSWAWTFATSSLENRNESMFDHRLDPARQTMVARAVAAYAAIAAILWLDAWRRFRAEQNR
jgi:ABC-type transport system involved in multi-copper enzyme maturation permease subunit